MTNTLSPATHEVANLGYRPHNIELPHLDTIIAQRTGELAILMLKPGFFPVHPVDGKPLQRLAEGMLTAANIDVVCTAERFLSPLEACELYRSVLPPNREDDEVWGTNWKKELIHYLSSDASVFSYLLEGDATFAKAHRIKNILRGCYATDTDTQIVRNVGHVPDPHDFDISLSILFKDGLTANTLEDSEAF